jgi:hypothetical protein
MRALDGANALDGLFRRLSADQERGRGTDIVQGKTIEAWNNMSKLEGPVLANSLHTF